MKTSAWTRAFGVTLGSVTLAGCVAGSSNASTQDDLGVPAWAAERLRRLSPTEPPKPPIDVTNKFADDPRAAELGKKLFFEKRFSGPLLDEDDTGLGGTLGKQGEAEKVGCVGCHLPDVSFLDARSPRAQLSLASSWTRRRAPSLLDVGQATLLMWDGRRDTAYNQVFGVIESPIEFNSSRLFVVQQFVKFYAADYEALFGPLPDLSAYATVDSAGAGCTELDKDPMHQHCPQPAVDDAAIDRIIVNMGKSIEAYERLLSCGSGRFDEWVHGDRTALSDDEVAGAVLFVNAGCDTCHSGPFLSDQKFHNVGSGNVLPNFIPPFDDPGASGGLADALADPLNSKGVFSDADDGRLDHAGDPADKVGAFRTPTLRCVGQRPSFMHAAQLRSIEDVVAFFNRGGDPYGFQGTKDASIVPLGLDDDGSRQLAAFLRALDGPGPSADLIAAPSLPQPDAL